MAAPTVRGWAADPVALADFLEEPDLARIGTVGPDGDPHVVPAWFWWDGERFHIGAQATDRKVADIRRSGRASVEIDGDIRRKRGLLATGPAAIVEGPEARSEYIRITTEQVRRYQPGRPPRETAVRYAADGEPVVIVVEPERIISWGR